MAQLQAIQAENHNDDERRRMQKNALMKMAAVAMFAVATVVFGSIAWFASNKNITGSGMGVAVKNNAFDLKTAGSAGLYDGFLDSVVSGYGNGLTTSGTQGIKWKLTNSSEMHNYYDGDETPDLREITRRDSSDYGLKPGDSGTLQFTIVPNSAEELNIKLNLDVTGYQAVYALENGVYYKTNDAMTVVTDQTINHFLSSHIYFFYKDENENKQMITSDGFHVSVTEETDITIYWVWPATLREILDENIENLDDTGASKEVKRLFFEHPDYFLKKSGDESFSEFTVAHNSDPAAEDTAIAAVIENVDGRHYSEYGAKYNDADQTIGDNINYMLLELFAVQEE